MSEKTDDLLSEIRDLLRQNAKDARLWKAEDIAEYFAVAPQTVRNSIVRKPGFPRPIMASGSRRWKPSEVKAYAERQR
jgi:predicted DNA-binding transcriptional regulator AlpA